jgi:predicted DNA-binding WGR domain protein
MVAASLVFQDEVSNKFWNIETSGKMFTTTWGRIGTFGQSNSKEFYDNKACEREANKIIASKVKKGYVEAITEDLIKETFMSMLSGIADYKCPGEAYYRNDKFSKLATLEFVGGLKHIVFRHYYENGNKKSEHEWISGKQDGRDLGWYEDGRRHWERKFSAGKLVSENRY